MKSAPEMKKVMTAHPYIASRKMSVATADELMRGCSIRHLPVVENHKVVGIVSHRDLRQAVLLSHSKEMYVEDVMIEDPYVVSKGTPVTEVARVMAKKKIGSAIVVDEQDHVVGIFTSVDGMRLLSTLFDSGSQNGLKLRGIEEYIDYVAFA